jgi:hydroxymethylbilane synthase
MQSELPEDFELIAFTHREKVHDVLVGHIKPELQNTHSTLTLGTSSARRKALLQYYYPHIRTVEIRGNLQTRIAKMEAGLCDAIVLAYAGVHRMDYDALIVYEFPIGQFIPAVGQGSIAVEVLSAMPAEKKALIRQFVNHQKTEQCLRAERAFLKTLRGGCSIPVFALGTLSGKDLHLRGGVIKLDGKKKIQESVTGPALNPESLGNQLARQVLEQGGEAILEDIRKQLNHS